MNPPKESIDFCSKWKGEKVLFDEVKSGNLDIQFRLSFFFRIIESDDIIVAEILSIIDYAS